MLALAVASVLFHVKAAAVQYCIDLGGMGWDCQEVPGWKRVVTQVLDASGWNNAGGVCSYADYPTFRPGTYYAEYTDTTCDGQVLYQRFSYYCVGSTVPSVGEQIGGGTEVPYNGNDEDCNPATPDDDLDGDGYLKADECNDNDNTIYPGAREECDGKDNNCNGIVDEECEGGNKPDGALGAPQNNGGPRECR